MKIYHYVVLCPLNLEFDSIISAFEKENSVRIFDSEIKQLKGKEIHFSNNKQEFVRILVLQLNRQGVLSASLDTRSFLKLNCVIGHIVSFGIAGTIKPDELDIGDVLVANSINYYEPQRLQKPFKLPRHNHFSVSNLGSNNSIFKKFCDSKSDDYSIVMDRGLASGEKLVADFKSSLRKNLAAINDHIGAVDMESAGVAAAAEWSFGIKSKLWNKRILAIKGISDRADDEKSSLSKNDQKRNRKTAAQNASEVLKNIFFYEDIKERVEKDRASISRINNCQKSAEEIKKIIPELFLSENKPTVEQIARATFHFKDEKPAIFYHWNQWDSNLHVVEYLFLSILGKLQEKGYPIKCLVTDINLNSEQKENLKSDVVAVCGREPSIYTEASAKHNADVQRMTSEESLFHQRLSDISNSLENEFIMEHMKEKFYLQNAKQYWYCFLPWYCLNNFGSRSSIVLSWDRRSESVKKILDAFPRHETCIIDTSDILISEEPAKKFEHTKDLKIDLRKQEITLQQFQNLPNDKVKKDLLKYFKSISNIGGYSNHGTHDLSKSIERVLSC